MTKYFNSFQFRTQRDVLEEHLTACVWDQIYLRKLTSDERIGASAVQKHDKY